MEDKNLSILLFASLATLSCISKPMNFWPSFKAAISAALRAQKAAFAPAATVRAADVAEARALLARTPMHRDDWQRLAQLGYAYFSAGAVPNSVHYGLTDHGVALAEGRTEPPPTPIQDW